MNTNRSFIAYFFSLFIALFCSSAVCADIVVIKEECVGGGPSGYNKVSESHTTTLGNDGDCMDFYVLNCLDNGTKKCEWNIYKSYVSGYVLDAPEEVKTKIQAGYTEGSMEFNFGVLYWSGVDEYNFRFELVSPKVY